MEDHEVKKLRKSMKASVSQMADILGLHTKNGPKKLRDIEAHKGGMTGPLKKIVSYLKQGFDTKLPKFLICSDVEKSSNQWILHTGYPRFIAHVSTTPSTSPLSVKIHSHWFHIVQTIDEPVHLSDMAKILHSLKKDHYD